MNLSLSQSLLHGTYNSIYDQMEYKEMLYTMQDEKNRKGSKLCGFCLGFWFVCFLNKKKSNLGSHNEDYFCQRCG